jgi:hypothetical protein
MKVAVLLFVTAFAFGLAGCEKMKEPATKPKTENVGKSVGLPPGGVPTPSVSAPTAKETKDSSPVQGQVDTREAPQKRDFEKK